MQKLLTSWWTWSSMIADWLLLLKQSNVAVLCNFLVNTSHQVMPRISLPSIHTIYGMKLSKIMMMKSWQKKKSTLWSLSMLLKMEKNSFYLKWEKEQYFMTKGLHICLPITCHLFELPGHLGQVIKVALLNKEEVSTQILATVLEKNIHEMNFLLIF